MSMNTKLEWEVAQLREVLGSVLTMPEYDGTRDTSNIRTDIKRRARALLKQDPDEHICGARHAYNMGYDRGVADHCDEELDVEEVQNVNKALRVTISLEFPDVASPDGEEADGIIQSLLIDMKSWEKDVGAAAMWIDDVCIVSGGAEMDKK